MHTLCVYTVLTHADGRVLCVRSRSDGLWQTPGGPLEAHESPDMALMRMALNQALCRVKPMRVWGTYASPYKNELHLMFECQLIEQFEFEPNAHMSEWGMFDPAQVPLPMTLANFCRIQDYVAQRQTIYRVFPRRQVLTNKLEVLRALSFLESGEEAA